MCECITTVDKLLSEHNARLGVTFNMLTGKTYPKITVEKLESKKRGSPPLMIPTFCPFCGAPYEPEPVSPTTIAAAEGGNHAS